MNLGKTSSTIDTKRFW